MDTKHKGDIAEQAVIIQALKRDWSVAKPIGDRLPYDLILDIGGKLIKIQVKYAWYEPRVKNYVIDTGRTKTNRRVMLRKRYQSSDFDFALVYIENLDTFYVLPVEDFVKYGSHISFVEEPNRQRKARSTPYRNAWDLLTKWATHEAIRAGNPIKIGEASDEVIPSQARLIFRKNIDAKV